MPGMTTPRHVPTPQQVREQQTADAERRTAAKKAALAQTAAKVAGTQITTTPGPSVPAVDDGRTPVQHYIDAIAPSSIAGRLIKFSKAGAFVIAEAEEEINLDEDFVAMCDETLVGWIKFNDEAPPDRHMGILYDGFIMPHRETLGDLDPAEWPLGLSGAPVDPWQHQIMLVLMKPGTHELFTFATTSTTGRRAIGSLLRHYDRLRRSDPGLYPVVRLKPSGFNHRDPKIGWVATPSFAVVGQAPKASATIPDTSPAADLNDEIPF
jgi:hypothetical protein